MTGKLECRKDILRVRKKIKKKVRLTRVQPQRGWHEVAVLIEPIFRKICTNRVYAAAFKQLAQEDGISSSPRSGSISSGAVCRFMLHDIKRLEARHGDSRIHRLSAGVMYGYRHNVTGKTLLSALTELGHSGVVEDYKEWKKRQIPLRRS